MDFWTLYVDDDEEEAAGAVEEEGEAEAEAKGQTRRAEVFYDGKHFVRLGAAVAGVAVAVAA